MTTDNKPLNIRLFASDGTRHSMGMLTVYNNSRRMFVQIKIIYKIDCIFQELLYYLFRWIGHVLVF